MGNVELERTSYIGFVSEKFEEKHFYNFFTTFSGEEKNLRKTNLIMDTKKQTWLRFKTRTSCSEIWHSATPPLLSLN
jgi:hypothetical protein